MIKKVISIFLMCIFVFLSFSQKTATAMVSEKINMAYLYGSSEKNYKTYINRTNNSVNVVLPDLFSIDENGNVELTGVIDIDFAEEMHSNGIKVIPYISNHWDRELGRAALRNYQSYIDDVVNIVNQFNLDGVNIDIENLTEDDKENLVEFTKYLREKLPEGKTVSMAVAANPHDVSTGWHGSYDYEELNKYVDMFILMSYDQSYYGSEAGPVASIDFVEDSIISLLEYTTSDKIIMGVPFYGRYWNTDESVGGNAITNASVQSIKNAFYAKEFYDEYAETPYLKFSVNKIQSLYKVANKRFAEGNYILYYENDRSIKQKLILVEKYNLAGSAIWALSQEDTSIWDNYNSWLNGIYYSDINDSWAKDYIKQVTIDGYMNGSTIYKFSPKRNMTREEFAAVICRYMGYNDIIVNGIYKDVNQGRWTFNYINTLYSHGIMHGSNERFYPMSNITREEVAAVIYRLLNDVTEQFGSSNNSFTDVNDLMWSKKYIDYCAAKGILEGYEDGSFRPHDEITREEIAALMERIKK